MNPIDNFAIHISIIVKVLIELLGVMSDRFTRFTLCVLAYRCSHNRFYYRWRRCDCYVPINEQPRPTFLFHQIDEPNLMPSPVKSRNEFEALCLSAQEAQQALLAVAQSGLNLLESVRREDEPPPYPEFFINH